MAETVLGQSRVGWVWSVLSDWGGVPGGGNCMGADAVPVRVFLSYAREPLKHVDAARDRGSCCVGAVWTRGGTSLPRFTHGTGRCGC